MGARPFLEKALSGVLPILHRLSEAGYNEFMSKRRIRLILALVVLVISLALLIWGLWPLAHLTRILPLPPGDLQLPTPDSFWLGMLPI